MDRRNRQTMTASQAMPGGPAAFASLRRHEAGEHEGVFVLTGTIDLDIERPDDMRGPFSDFAIGRRGTRNRRPPNEDAKASPH